MEKTVLDELDWEDRRRRRNERILVLSIVVIGLLLAVFAGVYVTDIDEGYRSITCEEGNVTLILEKADGTIERLECPAGVPVKP